MKKYAVILLLFAGLALGGCGKGTDSGTQGGDLPQNGAAGAEDEGGSGAETPEAGFGEGASGTGETSKSGTETSGMADGEGPGTQETAGGEADGAPVAESGNRVAQGGPYGEISLVLPEGWEYEAYPIESDEMEPGRYGIRFWPESAGEGAVDVSYIDRFGVCGTELESREAVIAGQPAHVGTYVGHVYWNFISFREDYKGVVAMTDSVESWWGDNEEQVTEILDTILFDPDTREGWAYVYTQESEIDKIGLHFSLKRITATGATLVFSQYDPDAPDGELMYGSDFVIEVNRDGKWEEAPIVVKGEYGFTAEGYSLEADGTSEMEMSWEWLYGALAPGEYRIGKDIHDFRRAGDFDVYRVYAHFILN